MVLGIGFLLLVSLVCSAGLSALGNFIGDYLSGREMLLKTLNFVISLGELTYFGEGVFTIIGYYHIGN